MRGSESKGEEMRGNERKGEDRRGKERKRRRTHDLSKNDLDFIEKKNT